jgi:hypothetical protein
MNIQGTMIYTSTMQDMGPSSVLIIYYIYIYIYNAGYGPFQCPRTVLGRPEHHHRVAQQ